MTVNLQYVTEKIAMCEAARSLPAPPTGDGADVSDWTQAPRNGQGNGLAVPWVEVTVLAGADVSLADGAAIYSEEEHDTFPEESNAVTLTNATEIVNYTAHGFYTGDGPVRLSGTLPAQLDDETEYYVIRVDADDLKLAATRADALAGTDVEFASDGADVVLHWVTGTKSTSQNASAHDGDEDTFTIAAHGIATGTRVQVANSGGGLPTGLAANTDYYAIRVDAATLSFATTAELAAAGTAIDFDGDGTGTQSVISDNRGPTEETVYLLFKELNEGYALDLKANVGYREVFAHRPGVLAYHLVTEKDAFVPLTSYVQGLHEVDR